MDGLILCSTIGHSPRPHQFNRGELNIFRQYDKRLRPYDKDDSVRTDLVVDLLFVISKGIEISFLLSWTKIVSWKKLFWRNSCKGKRLHFLIFFEKEKEAANSAENVNSRLNSQGQQRVVPPKLDELSYSTCAVVAEPHDSSALTQPMRGGVVYALVFAFPFLCSWAVFLFSFSKFFAIINQAWFALAGSLTINC